MFICREGVAYKCNDFRSKTIGNILGMEFDILEPVSHSDVANLFSDNTFYFYDDVLKGRFVDTNNTRLVGLRITYNDDSTSNIKIKLTKGDVENEG